MSIESKWIRPVGGGGEKIGGPTRKTPKKFRRLPKNTAAAGLVVAARSRVALGRDVPIVVAGRNDGVLLDDVRV